MFQYFTLFADVCVKKMGIDSASPLGNAVSFFIEDSLKIFLLIYLLIFVLSLFRTQLSPKKIQKFLSGHTRWYGYFLAVFLGVVTPFCSCSGIPLFIGFLAAGVPFGITMAFLISSPLISEMALVLLSGMKGAGLGVAVTYVAAGTFISVLGGWLADKLQLKKLLTYIPLGISPADSCCCCKQNLKDKAVLLIKDAHFSAWKTLREIGPYVVFGLGIGGLIHGYVPGEILEKYLGEGNLWAVPFAAVAGAPIYANHVGVLPVIQAFLLKGIPVGTSLVLLMSITAISLPEILMLKKVFSWKLIVFFLMYLLFSFMLVGYLINWIW